MRRLLRENGLSIVLLLLFLVSVVGQTLSGRLHHNEERAERGQRPLTVSEYLASGAFAEAIFENWESEFLQMAAYVVLTVFLRQKGSSESKPIEGEQPVDADPRKADKRKRVPWPVRKGGWVLKLYENSLGLALGLLFLFSFLGHAIGGAKAEAEEHGRRFAWSAGETLHYMGSSRFWFESFQNWQSEFLSVALIVILSVYLRQRGSPESKPVAAPHAETEE